MSVKETQGELPLGMSFGEAIGYLKCGCRVARTGWNGKGMWLVLIDAQDRETASLLCKQVSELNGKPVGLLSWIGMKTADDNFVPWLASQTDILADDWLVVL
jgi:hypothetical protein